MYEPEGLEESTNQCRLIDYRVRIYNVRRDERGV